MRLFLYWTFLFIAVVAFSSCTLQKRKHLPGYSVQWNTKPAHQNISKHENQPAAIKSDNNEVEYTPISDERAYASSELETAVVAKNIYRVLAKSMVTPSIQDSCDNLITKEGDEFRCKVVEIGVDVIKYKKCGVKDGPLISIPRSAVLMIRYSNGEKEIIKEYKQKQDSEYVNSNDQKPKKRLDVMGLVGFCLTIASILPWWFVSAIIGFVAGILGIVFGSISLARIVRKRDSRKGLGFAIVSLILGVLLVVATLIVWAAIGVI